MFKRFQAPFMIVVCHPLLVVLLGIHEMFIHYEFLSRGRIVLLTKTTACGVKAPEETF